MGRHGFPGLMWAFLQACSRRRKRHRLGGGAKAARGSLWWVSLSLGPSRLPGLGSPFLCTKLPSHVVDGWVTLCGAWLPGTGRGVRCPWMQWRSHAGHWLGLRRNGVAESSDRWAGHLTFSWTSVCSHTCPGGRIHQVFVSTPVSRSDIDVPGGCKGSFGRKPGSWLACERCRQEGTFGERWRLRSISVKQDVDREDNPSAHPSVLLHL